MIYTDYLLKNFGNANLKGFQCLSYLYDNCDLNDNLCDIYKQIEVGLNLSGSSERAIRHYIEKNIKQMGLKKVESILECKADKPKKFTNKAFIMTVKLRAEGIKPKITRKRKKKVYFGE